MYDLNNLTIKDYFSTLLWPHISHGIPFGGPFTVNATEELLSLQPCGHISADFKWELLPKILSLVHLFTLVS